MTTESAATILVIDDEPSVREFFARALEGAGLTAVRAATSEAALRLLEGGLRPDAVLLDVDMPGMGGLGFLLRLQASPRYARLPVAIVTAHTAGPSLRTVAQSMRVPVHFKPLDVDELLRITDRLLHGSLAGTDDL